jgi:LacI family transcriptional regulator
MSYTIRDLAEKLNLSITTVSRALDGYSDVAEDTRLRVIETAREMGYEPSYAARQLRRKRSDTIGYILPTSEPQFSDPFYTVFLAGLCDEAASRSIDLMISSCAPESEREKNQYRHWIKSRRVDGMIINRVRIHDWRVEYLLENQFPFVSVGKSDLTPPYPHIDVDDREGIRQLVQHLVRKGHRRIAFIGASPELVLHQERFSGYFDGLQDSAIRFDPALEVSGDLTEIGGYQAGRMLLERPEPPTAVIGCNDLTALGVLRAAREMGIYIGTELAIAGYDGIKETEYTNPPLTTLLQPTYDIARALAVMLLNQLDDQPPNETQMTINPQLIIRPSTG